MTSEEAVRKSAELNLNGIWKRDWYYYPAYHEIEKEWFVCRRLKTAEFRVSVFINGEISVFES